MLPQRICPYCARRPGNSDDHIFSQFLGATATIRACKQCNGTFGHSFEGALSSDLAPFVVFLRRAGLRPPRFVVWKRALKNPETEIEYDLDSELQLQPSYPKIERDEAGKPKRAVFGPQKSAAEFKRGLEAKGKKVRLKEEVIKDVPLTQAHFQLTVGDELRRLAAKLAVGTAHYLNHRDGILDPTTRTYLVEGRSAMGGPPARMDFSTHVSLENLRPPLGHLVFVEGNSETRRCYAVVQFYGTIQLYVILNANGFHGSDFAILATLDPASGYKENFRHVDLFKLPEAPLQVSPAEYEAGLRSWQEKFNKQAESVFGAGALTLTVERRPQTEAPSSVSSTGGAFEIHYVDENGKDIWPRKPL